MGNPSSIFSDMENKYEAICTLYSVCRLTAVCVHVIMPENIMYVYCELST